MIVVDKPPPHTLIIVDFLSLGLIIWQNILFTYFSVINSFTDNIFYISINDHLNNLLTFLFGWKWSHFIVLCKQHSLRPFEKLFAFLCWTTKRLSISFRGIWQSQSSFGCNKFNDFSGCRWFTNERIKHIVASTKNRVFIANAQLGVEQSLSLFSPPTHPNPTLCKSIFTIF